MTQIEKDLVYKILPNLTKAIDKLGNELKRYNDNTFDVAFADKDNKSKENNNNG